jgi:hypothetical protein
MIVLLREPLGGKATGTVPEPLYLEAEVGSRWIGLTHDDDSLQWVVSAAYPEPGPRADKGEATEAQWVAFNADIDATLDRIHARWPIAAVIRPVDDEYGCETSDWHEHSMAALPEYLPCLAAALEEDPSDVEPDWYVEHACDLWRWWLSGRPVAEQQERINALTPAQRSALDEFGGVPDASEPEVKLPAPTLDELLAAWHTVGPDEDPFVAFAAAMAPREWELHQLNWALKGLKDPSPEQRQVLIEVQRRALAAPSCRWPDTHWRPGLVDSLIAIGALESARLELGRVVLGAVSYLTSNWASMVNYLDACGRDDDASAVHALASRHVVHFADDHPRTAPPVSVDRAAGVLLELAAPALDDLDAMTAVELDSAAFSFEDLVREGLGNDALTAQAVALRDHARRQRTSQFGAAATRIAAGEILSESEVKELLRAAPGMNPDHVRLVVTAALTHPDLIGEIGMFALALRDQPEAAKAAFLALINSPVPLSGDARTSWLMSANNALVVTHGEGWFELSAQLADQVVRYVTENPYITHAAACSYVAVGRLDDALTQARLAVELGYDHLAQLRVDTDLAPLLERPDFQALFE